MFWKEFILLGNAKQGPELPSNGILTIDTAQMALAPSRVALANRNRKFLPFRAKSQLLRFRAFACGTRGPKFDSRSLAVGKNLKPANLKLPVFSD